MEKFRSITPVIQQNVPMTGFYRKLLGNYQQLLVTQFEQFIVVSWNSSICKVPYNNNTQDDFQNIFKVKQVHCLSTDFTFTQWYAAETNHPSKTCMNKAVPLCSLTNLQLRFLCPSDLAEVRALCEDWFPIDYPYTWYEDITSNPRFYSLAAVYEGIIIGLIVAEIKSYFKLNREDKDILAASFGKSCCVGYILSLGVSEKHRRNGIASLLLENLVSHLTSPEYSHCKAIFLHVLTVNSVAIHFYEHRHFRLHSFLPYYYSINGKSKDGFTYVLYINGGHSPWGIYDYVKYGCGLLYQLDVCAWVTARMRGALAWVWPGMRRIVVENTTALITH